MNLGLLLEIFSDARVVAPLVRAANLQSNSERASYLYVFKHTTEAGYYPEHGAGGIRWAASLLHLKIISTQNLYLLLN